MNKAFVREPEDTGERNCPRCGSLGVAVPRETVEAQVTPAGQAALAETAFFCPYGMCDVAYFDLFDRLVTIEALLRPVYPKDPEAPMCGCFGLTRDDVEADVREGGVARVRALLEKSKSAEARCTTRSASGHCCMPEVQKYFMKLRSGE